ncbi:hypothetical protein KJ991_01415, partial [Patescibacteria group bacterium]|nr:hypothetical protein [Patescibacteria group bacterium]MBU4115831.1 hypothetical protein [Patescibacteria group bacterium]
FHSQYRIRTIVQLLVLERPVVALIYPIPFALRWSYLSPQVDGMNFVCRMCKVWTYLFKKTKKQKNKKTRNKKT